MIGLELKKIQYRLCWLYNYIKIDKALNIFDSLLIYFLERLISKKVFFIFKWKKLQNPSDFLLHSRNQSFYTRPIKNF